MDKVNETIKNILKRRSVRNFEAGKIVEKWKLNHILAAALSAPSAKNYRPCRFLVLNDREIMDELAAGLSQTMVFERAPLAIAVCADLSGYPDGSMAWLEDCSAALENMLIAATSLELASLWFGVYARDPKEEVVRRVLRVPEHVEVQGIAVIGYSADKPSPRCHDDISMVTYGRWSDDLKKS